VSPAHDCIKFVIRDSNHQITSNDAAAHPTAVQEGKAAEHLAFGDVVTGDERPPNAICELLVVRHGILLLTVRHLLPVMTRVELHEAHVVLHGHRAEDGRSHHRIVARVECRVDVRHHALEITPDVFRKRLQHARAAILSFTRSYCGLVSDTAACACNRRVPAALRLGRVRTDSFDFAATSSSLHEARAIVRQVDEARWALEIHRTSHPRDSPVDFARRLAQALDPRPD
jgi:hypothetical protein